MGPARSSVMLARALALAWLLALGAGCGDAGDAGAPQSSTPLSPGPPETPAPGVELLPLGYEAEVNARVAGVALDREGRQAIAVASARELAVLRVDPEAGTSAVGWRAEVPGGATAVATGDVDGDGHDDLVVGWGVHREHRDAPAVLRVYRTRGAKPGGLLAEEVARPSTSRAQFSSVEVTALDAGGPPGVLFAHYVSKYDVRGAFATLDAGGWEERELYRIRMGAQLVAAPLRAGAEPVLVVGRPYGDAVKSEGDVFVLGPDGGRTPLPSVRGVRSLAAVDVGPSGSPVRLVCYGDGWHWRYREMGRGLVTCARATGDGSFEARVVGETAGYGIDTIAAGDVDGDGVRELLAQGPEGLYLFEPARAADGSLAWSQRTIGPAGFQFAVVDVDGDGRDEIALGGERPALLRVLE